MQGNYRLRSSYQLEKDNIFPTPKQQPMTHKSILFFVFSAILSLASAQNLALNMPVTVTSTEGGLIGENAVDGSMSTRWSSAFSEPHSISVDLGDVYDLDRVVIHWEAAFAVAYDVEVSMDGV